MTPKQAKRILLSMVGRGKTYVLSEDSLCVTTLPGFVSSNHAPKKVSLNGEFTADQLEAIATWMRDPKGVAEE
jgi:hypothetical protein